MSNFLDYLNEQYEKGEISLSEKRDGELQYKKGDFHKKRQLDKNLASFKSQAPNISKSDSESLINDIDNSDAIKKREIVEKKVSPSKNSKGSFFQILGNILKAMGVLIWIGGVILKGLLNLFIFITRRN
jgi:hypothetical protein